MLTLPRCKVSIRNWRIAESKGSSSAKKVAVAAKAPFKLARTCPGRYRTRFRQRWWVALSISQINRCQCLCLVLTKKAKSQPLRLRQNEQVKVNPCGPLLRENLALKSKEAVWQRNHLCKPVQLNRENTLFFRLLDALSRTVIVQAM